MHTSLRWREIPFALLSTVVLAALANDALLGGGERPLLSHGDGLALLGYFAIYLYYLFSMARSADAPGMDSQVEVEAPVSMPLAWALCLGGIAGLALGGQWIVKGGSGLAAAAGMSQALVGLTLVAVGTSLPELATSLVAARRGNADMAVGNVVGSNVFNVLWILGITATVKPVGFNPAMNTDLWCLLGATALFFAFTFTGRRHRIDRWEGALFLLLYAGYTAFLVWRG
jgi:cation:H+ antiporter